jgi:hypothetical protein
LGDSNEQPKGKQPNKKTKKKSTTTRNVEIREILAKNDKTFLKI